MDAQRFDALTRSLHTSGTRRALSGLLATLLGLLALTRPGIALETEAKKKNRRRKKVKAEGPCGDGGGKANRCRKHRQCCTGYCQKRKKKRKNGRRRKVQGRCRCRKEGQTCSDDTNCCPERTGRICKAGTCQIPLCTDQCPAGCCAGETCEDGDSDEACGTGGAPCQNCGQAGTCVEGACVCGDVCASGCAYANIQAAIDDPAGPTTIRLCAETYGETLTLTRDLTLLGAGEGADGSVLDGNESGTVVSVAEGVVASLQDLRITGGVADQPSEPDGGGIYNRGELSLTRVTVIDNAAGDDGGGIYNDATGDLSLTNCTVTLNTSTWDGAGIDNRGMLALSETRVTDNTAGGSGGGISNLGSAATIDASDITDNTSTLSGGGIYTTTNMTITGGSTVSGNEALTGSGGGINNNSGGLEISESSVTLNKALDAQSGYGGGISNGFMLTVTAATITHNEAGADGGGIYNVGSLTFSGTNDLSDNTPNECGGVCP